MKKIILVLSIISTNLAHAGELKIITSTETLSSIVKELGGEYVDVDYLSRGTEDPHYVEAKPSFMVKVRNADSVVVVGLELEKAWMDNVLTGSRNPNVMPGGKGFLDLGQLTEPLETVSGTLDRGQGDVHPLGNPHYYLDPIRIKNLLPYITEKIASYLPKQKEELNKRLKIFSDKLEAKNKDWTARIQKLETKKVITYHRTLLYFLDRFHIALDATIEPKPGIPPTVSHTMSLIQQAEKDNVRCILNESHFETVAAQRISKEIKAQVSVVPTEVGALPDADNYISLIEKIVSGLEKCK